MKVFLRVAFSALAIMLLLLSLVYPWMLILVAACVFGIIKADTIANRQKKDKQQSAVNSVDERKVEKESIHSAKKSADEVTETSPVSQSAENPVTKANSIISTKNREVEAVIQEAKAILADNKQALKRADEIMAAKEAELKRLKSENYKVVGLSYRKDNVESLGDYNEEYDYSKDEVIDSGLEDTRIYKYQFFPGKVELVEEPDNKYDPNAVMVAVEGVHVGYIQKGRSSHVKKLIREDRIHSLEIEIYGGDYKYYDSVDENMKTVSIDFGAKLTVYLKRDVQTDSE